MKAFNRFSVLAALCFISTVLMTTGCIKDNPSTSDDLQFSAQSTIETKAVYGLDVDEYQRIIWQSGDEVTIASDGAQTLWGRKSCDYIVTPESGDETAATRQSKGKISRKPTVVDKVEDSGLRWSDDTNYADFWSVYPASAAQSIDDKIITATIPSQTTLGTAKKRPAEGSKIIEILDPVNGSYPMAAYTPNVASNTTSITLQFYPAFTAFQVTLTNNTNESITLSSCSVTSETVNLCGTFSAPISDVVAGQVSLGADALQNAGKEVSVGLSNILAPGEGVTFSIFCLPLTLTDLTFTCTYVNSTGKLTKKLDLTKDNEFLSFAACEQHRLILSLTEVGLKPLSLGGAQMLLNIIFYNRQKLIQYLKAYYGLGQGESSQEYNNMLSSLLYKLGNWEINTEHYGEADKIFNGNESYSLTAEELAIIQGFLTTVTWSGSIGSTAQTKITSSIVSSDFDWVPNLQQITSMDGVDSDANPGASPIDLVIENNSKISSIHLEHFGNIVIDNCDGLTGAFNIGNSSSDLSIINTPNLSDCYITIKNCDNITEFYDQNRDFSRYTITFENNSSLQKIRFEGQKVKEIIVKDCDSFTTLELTSDDTYPKNVELVDNEILERLEFKFVEKFTVKDCPAFKEFYVNKPDHGEAHLSSITLTNTPVFELGVIGVSDKNTSNNITVNLTDCAHQSAVTPAKLAYYRDPYMDVPSVNRIQNADNVKLYRRVQGAMVTPGYNDPDQNWAWIPPVYDWTYEPY